MNYLEHLPCMEIPRCEVVHLFVPSVVAFRCALAPMETPDTKEEDAKTKKRMYQQTSWEAWKQASEAFMTRKRMRQEKGICDDEAVEMEANERVLKLGFPTLDQHGQDHHAFVDGGVTASVACTE